MTQPEAIQIILREAEKAGVVGFTEDDAGYLLWNDTGWPSFWSVGADPAEEIRLAARAALAGGNKEGK